ncbi:hypothetical protein AAF712_016533 [Marasmius tenuissimus]|uniref:Uncharacterized protein n=1 Tax=Marasmius tenuissimus TaxID=585030 RepID=A0ABR2Z7T0_9AGAR
MPVRPDYPYYSPGYSTVSDSCDEAGNSKKVDWTLRELRAFEYKIENLMTDIEIRQLHTTSLLKELIAKTNNTQRDSELDIRVIKKDLGRILDSLSVDRTQAEPSNPRLLPIRNRLPAQQTFPNSPPKSLKRDRASAPPEYPDYGRNKSTAISQFWHRGTKRLRISPTLSEVDDIEHLGRHQRNITYPMNNSNNSLGYATYDELVNSQNPVFRQAVTTIDNLKMELNEKDRTIADRDKELVEVHTKYETTKSTLDDMMSKLPSLSSGNSADGLIFITKPKLADLEQQNYLNVRFWRQRTFDDYEAQHANNETNGFTTAKRKPGRPRKSDSADDDDPVYIWLEGEDGKPADEARRSQMVAKLYRLCKALFDRGLASNTWGNISDTSAEYVILGLCHEYIEFRLSEGRWKAEKFVTLKYGGWARRHFPAEHTRQSKKRKQSSPDTEPEKDIEDPSAMEIDSGTFPPPGTDGHNVTPNTNSCSQEPGQTHEHESSQIVLDNGEEQRQLPDAEPEPRTSTPAIHNVSHPVPDAPASLELARSSGARVQTPSLVFVPSQQIDPFGDASLYINLNPPAQTFTTSTSPGSEKGGPDSAASPRPASAPSSSAAPTINPPEPTPTIPTLTAKVSGPKRTAAKPKSGRVCVPNESNGVQNLARRRFCEIQSANGKPAFETEFVKWYNSPDSASVRQACEGDSKKHRAAARSRKNQQARQAASDILAGQSQGEDTPASPSTG